MDKSEILRDITSIGLLAAAVLSVEFLLPDVSTSLKYQMAGGTIALFFVMAVAYFRWEKISPRLRPSRMLAFDLFYFLRVSLLSYLAFVMGFAVVVTWVWTTFDGAGYVVTWYNVLGVGLLITSAYALYLAAFDVVHWRQKRLAFQRRNAIRRKGT